jgi:hypothetical protein
MRVKSLCEKYKLNVLAISPYLGFSYNEDMEYGKKAIDNSARIAVDNPKRTIILRVLCGQSRKSLDKRKAISNLGILLSRCVHHYKKNKANSGRRAFQNHWS